MTDPLFTPLKSHPSTWQQEVAQLRDENTELALQGMIRNAQAAEAHEARLVADAEAEALRARVATLEAGLRGVIGMLDDPTGAEHVRDMRGATVIARAALEAKPLWRHPHSHTAPSRSRIGADTTTGKERNQRAGQ